MNAEVRILLVDDEESVLSALQRFFRRSGYLVTTCTSGRKGLAILEQSEPYHLVISDYRMPEMNGVEFLSAVRLRWPDTVRMVLSGFAETGAIIAATNEGNIYKFIPKPWDELFLLQSVHEALEIYARNRDRSEQMQILTRSLGEREETFQRVLDLMPSRLCVVNKQGQISITNRAWKIFAGLTPLPLVSPCSSHILSVCPHCSSACLAHYLRLEKEVNAILEGRTTEFYFECACPVTDTETRWFEVRGAALKDQDEPSVLVQHQDITHQLCFRDMENTKLPLL